MNDNADTVHKGSLNVFLASYTIDNSHYKQIH